MRQKYFLIYPTWHPGYPMPDKKFGYLEKSYDLANYCPVCGMGAVQKAPFRLAKIPKLTKKGIFQLNWVYDVYFIRKALWENIFRPFSIKARPVVLHRTGEIVPDVVQVEIEDTAVSAVLTEGLRKETCPKCGRTKYGYNAFEGEKFPPFLEKISGTIFQTQEYWGTGASAYRKVIVSTELKFAIENTGVTGVKFEEILG